MKILLITIVLLNAVISTAAAQATEPPVGLCGRAFARLRVAVRPALGLTGPADGYGVISSNPLPMLLPFLRWGTAALDEHGEPFKMVGSTGTLILSRANILEDFSSLQSTNVDSAEAFFRGIHELTDPVISPYDSDKLTSVEEIVSWVNRLSSTRGRALPGGPGIKYETHIVGKWSGRVVSQTLSSVTLMSPTGRRLDFRFRLPTDTEARGINHADLILDAGQELHPIHTRHDPVHYIITFIPN